jgi:alpha 1,3-mannosyltransferase
MWTPSYGAHLAPYFRKLLILTICVTIVLFGKNTRLVRSSSGHASIEQLPHADQPEQLPHADHPHLQLTVDAADWGLMARRVRQWGEWGAEIVAKPDLDQQPLIDAISAQFPWFENSEKSLYIPWASPRSSQTGIVMCVGSSNYHMAAHAIATLRRVHGCRLAIEIAYAGDDDLSPQHRAFLHSVADSVTFIDLLDTFPNAQLDLIHAGWAMKPFALLAASKPQTILIDADAIFLTSPDRLFQSHPGLARTGALFYHDRAIPGDGLEQRLYIESQLGQAGVPPSDFLTHDSLMYAGDSRFEADSGLVAFDKSVPGVFLGLIFAVWMNTRAVREAFSYKMFHGDKETFWIALELTGVPYTFEKLYAGSIGLAESGSASQPAAPAEPIRLCGKHMLHLDESGSFPFWFNGGIYEDKDRPDQGYVNLTHYWVDDRDRTQGSWPRWWWEGNNVACVREDNVKVVEAAIRETLSRIVQEATTLDEKIRNI